MAQSPSRAVVHNPSHTIVSHSLITGVGAVRSHRINCSNSTRSKARRGGEGFTINSTKSKGVRSIHPSDTARIVLAGEKWASLTDRKRTAAQDSHPRWKEAFARLLRVGSHLLHPDLYLLAGASANRQGCRAAVCLGSLSIQDQYHYLSNGLPMATYRNDKPVIVPVSVYEMSEAQRRQIFQRVAPFQYAVRDVTKQRQWLRKHVNRAAAQTEDDGPARRNKRR